MELSKKLERCGAIDFLAPLGEASVRRLIESCRELRVAAGEVLFEEGDPARTMYIVLEGRLLVYKKDHPLDTVGPGTYFGEMALVESKVRTASLRALEATVLLEISEEQFHAFVAENAAALLAIMKTLSVRSRSDLLVLDNNFRRLEEYAKEIEEANRKLEATRRELERSNRELERLSSLDTLTGLANRGRFDAALRSEWWRAARERTLLSLILCDIDCFKGYNDTYGHPAGDEVLVRVSEALRLTVRRPGDLAARYGGEEFVMILAGTDLGAAGAIAGKLRAGIEAMQIPHSGSSVSRWVTVSFGVATDAPGPGRGPDDLLARADRALYAAKQRGRNRVESDEARATRPEPDRQSSG